MLTKLKMQVSNFRFNRYLAVALGLALLVPLALAVLAVRQYVSSSQQKRAAVRAAQEMAVVMLTMDYRDREGWERKVKPLCTPLGWQFWETAMTQGMWNGLKANGTVVERVQVLGARAEEYAARGPMDPPGPCYLVTLELEVYHHGTAERNTFPMVVAYDLWQDRWLFNGLPFQGKLLGGEQR